MTTEKVKTAKTFDELLNAKYGEIGTKKRDDFEERSHSFIISELIKSTRKEAKLTQEELAERIGTKKSYISKVEKGECDIQMSTFFKIFEKGFGKRVTLAIS